MKHDMIEKSVIARYYDADCRIKEWYTEYEYTGTGVFGDLVNLGVCPLDSAPGVFEYMRIISSSNISRGNKMGMLNSACDGLYDAAIDIGLISKIEKIKVWVGVGKDEDQGLMSLLPHRPESFPSSDLFTWTEVEVDKLV